MSPAQGRKGGCPQGTESSILGSFHQGATLNVSLNDVNINLCFSRSPTNPAFVLPQDISSNVRWILRAALCIDSYTTLSTESELQVDKNYLLKEIYIEYST